MVNFRYFKLLNIVVVFVNLEIIKLFQVIIILVFVIVGILLGQLLFFVFLLFVVGGKVFILKGCILYCSLNNLDREFFIVLFNFFVCFFCKIIFFLKLLLGLIKNCFDSLDNFFLVNKFFNFL